MNVGLNGRSVWAGIVTTAWCRRGAALLPLMLAVTVATCHDSPTAPGVGTLSVVIGGLPAGVAPVVTVTGPRSYTKALAATTTLSALPEGTYTVAATDVTANGVRYAASPATQTVVVAANGVATANRIGYTVATARLTVSVAGLPGGAPAGITVTGPNGFSRVITSTTTIDLLAPGAYTLAAADVANGGKTYRPSPATQTVNLAPGATPVAATVAYGAGTGTLTVTIAGLPSGTDAAVLITAPNGLTRTIAATTTLQYLEPGTYSLSAATVGSSLTTHAATPASQTVALADGAAGSATVSYGSAPLQLALQLFADGLTNPVYLTAPPGDARQFIVQRGGTVRIVENGVLLATPFLDIRTRVNSSGERGMLSIAFDPQYATNGFLYAYYVDLNGDMAVERLNSTPGSNVAGGSAGIVITIPHRGENHHGGVITFGPDGMLYVAPGDGGCCGDPQNNAQNTSNLLGKILRLDVRTLPYSIPAGNPFIGRVGAREEIWAYGFRNPWRYSFDPPSGTLFVGDVGQDAREEVDAVPASEGGHNFGWRLMEGVACYNPSSNCNPIGALTLPAIDYPHSEGCSVIGGFVYRGAAIPELTGHYLYSDFCGGWLRSFRLAQGSPTERRTWAGISLPQTVSFGRDTAGELYMIAGTKVFRIVRP